MWGTFVSLDASTKQRQRLDHAKLLLVIGYHVKIPGEIIVHNNSVDYKLKIVVEQAHDFLSLATDKVLPDVHGSYNDDEMALQDFLNVGVDDGIEYGREESTGKEERIISVGGVISGENLDVFGNQIHEPGVCEVRCAAILGVNEMIGGPIMKTIVGASLLKEIDISNEDGPFSPSHMLRGQEENVGSPCQGMSVGSPRLQQRREDVCINLSPQRQSRVSVRTIKPISRTRTDMEFYPYVSKRKGKRAKKIGVDGAPNLLLAAATFDDEGTSLGNEEQNSEVEGVWDIGSQVAIKFQEGKKSVVEKIVNLGVNMVDPNELA